MADALPHRGEIWLVKLDPTVGREQAGTRPGLIVSANGLNWSPSDLVIIVPLTTKQHNIIFHVAVGAADSGLGRDSFATCEDVRSVSRERLLKKVGRISPDCIAQVEYRLRVLLGL